jgi:hypothetical protein
MLFFLAQRLVFKSVIFSFFFDGARQGLPPITYYWTVPLILDHSLSRWEINKFENCRYKSVMILKVLKLLFQQFLNLSSSQRDVSGLMLGTLSNNR